MIWRALTRTASINLSTKLVSVAGAILLWIVVIGSRNVEVTKDIALSVSAPADFALVGEVPERVSFRLSGPKAFLRTLLDRKEEPIRVQLAVTRAGPVVHRFYSDALRLPIGVRIVSITPPQLSLFVEPLKKKDVPVRPVFRGAPPVGYRMVKSTLKPETVRVRGAQSRVDALAEIPSQPIDLEGVRRPIEMDVPLDLSRLGVVLDGATPKLLVQVEPVSANFRIKAVDIRVQANRKYQLDEKTVTVLVRAEPEDLKLLDRSRVYAEITIVDRPKGKHREKVKVTLPENVGLVKVVPDTVSVTVF